MLRVACSLALVLSVSSCTNEGGSDEAAESTADDPGTEDEIGSEGESTDDADTESSTTVEIPDCTPGAWGCTCAEGDTCSPDLACVDGICTFNECPTTYEGCACGEGETCMPGLFCVEGICGCQPGTVGCTCIDGTGCEGEMSCIEGECWLMSAYPNCGWDAEHAYYFCGFAIAHPDYPIDCPLGLIEGDPCPAELTFEGCCDAMGTWWCQGGTIAYAAC